jgi:hypothetical protein
MEAALQVFPVTSTVNLSGTSIGADFRAIRRKLTLRDLSTSIDSSDHHGYRRRHIGVGQGNAQQGLASNALVAFANHFSSKFFTIMISQQWCRRSASQDCCPPPAGHRLAEAPRSATGT